jgi:hypothetical protein
LLNLKKPFKLVHALVRDRTVRLGRMLGREPI